MRRVLIVLGTLALAAAPLSSSADDDSLPSVVTGVRPGPPVLYEPLATAPQLENTGGWEASPLMVSGADAYDSGEYLYQDYIYDSYGANTSNVLCDQPDTDPACFATLFGGATGDVVYPTNAAKYGFDAADLLEFRARPIAGGVEYRITLNTMLDAHAAAVAIGIDTDRDADTGSDSWGIGIGSLGHLGLDEVVYTNGDDVLLRDHQFAEGVEPFGATAYAARNQIDVKIPLDPVGAVWRHYVVVGLLGEGFGFKAIGEQPTPETPGGAHGTNPPPVFNVGFRFSEPMGSQYLSDPSSVATIANFGARASGYGHWRDDGQAHALAARDISAYHADIDFSKLAAGTVESHVPRHGWINRLYVSHLDLGEGAQPNRPMLLGKIQPYGVYVPVAYDDSHRAPFHLLMHSLSCSYNQYAVFTPNQLKQIGDDRGAILMTPEGRGPDGWYHDAAEVDVFEAWADLAHHYRIDPYRTTLGGYSMGGFGTLKLASQYPDLFARGFAVVPPGDERITGAPTGGMVPAAEDTQNTLHVLDNVRNVPLMLWEGTNDELVPLAGTLMIDKTLRDLGYRYQQWLFAGYDHFLESITDQWAEARDWLGADLVNRDPEQVVYRAMPEMDNSTLGLVHDHAYWVSAIKVAGTARSALVDVRAGNTAVGPPMPYDTAGAGVRAAPFGGVYVEKGTDWHATGQTPSNTLTLKLSDVGSATVWLARTNLDLDKPIALTADANVASTITFVFGDNDVLVLPIPAGHSTQTI